jgi:hypothetical protein
MCKLVFYLISFAFILFTATNASANLVANWRLDDGSGTVAKDSAGGYNGTLNGDTAWVEGKIGGALQFDGNGDYVDCGNNAIFNPTGDFSVTYWANITQWTTAWAESMLGKGGDNDRGGWAVRRGSGTSLCFTVAGAGGNMFGTATPTQNEWIHIACVSDQTNGQAYIYINGILDASFTVTGTGTGNSARLYLGNRGNSAGTGPDDWGPSFFGGMLDDIRFYDNALTEAEVQNSMKGVSLGFASNPSPQSNAENVSRNTNLSWKPGKFADTHNLYFGTDINDVNEATLTNSLGVTVVEGLDVNSYDPGRMDFGTTYYWRVDEVNAPPSTTVFHGEVWSFIVEPYSYKIPSESITATAISSSVDNDPNKTIDESGLSGDNLDLHSNSVADMWLSSGEDVNAVWIQYNFDRVYKLDKMLVWNYNIGFFIGADFKDVTIEYSEDGQTWTALDNVPEFAKATGKSGYKYNTVVDFNGLPVKYVKLTANSNWGGLTYYGLSEVRFMYIPVRARDPNPTNEETEVPINATLTWLAGREAAQHNVYISKDEQAVIDGTADVDTVIQAASGPQSLDLNRTYYWRVDEVNNAENPSVWASDIWSFSTAEFITVDDFEDYNGTAGYEIWSTWKDGFGTTNNGAQMGLNNSPYVERIIVHSGRQSAPVSYNNTSASMSEVTADTSNLAIGSDWSKGNPDTLVVWFRGEPNNAATDRLYLKLNNKKVIYDGDTLLSTTTWTEWDIDLPALGANLSSITSITLGLEKTGATGGSGMIYFDDIQLTSSEPAEEGGSSLIANPSFEDDGTANGTPSGWSSNNVAGGAGTSAGTVSTTDGGFYLWQGNGNYVYQTTHEVIASAGLTYKLQVDVRNSWNANPKIIIYYLDGTNRIELGSTTLPANGASWPAPVTMEVTATTTAASVGKRIGVELTIDNYPGNVWAHYDNVRLSKVE